MRAEVAFCQTKLSLVNSNKAPQHEVMVNEANMTITLDRIQYALGAPYLWSFTKLS